MVHNRTPRRWRVPCAQARETRLSGRVPVVVGSPGVGDVGAKVPFGKPSGDHEEMRGLPESRRPIVEEESIPVTEEELAKRRAAALRRWLENEMGGGASCTHRASREHGVKMRGGADEARAFVEELLEWKADGMIGDGERRKN